MTPIEKSGLAYPNKFGAILVRALEEVMGRNGLNAILNLAGLNHYIEHPLPDNLEKGFDFVEVAAVNKALEDMYGPRGGRGLSLRVGRALFADGLRNFGALAGVGDLAFKVLPLGAKLRIGLPAVAKIFSTISGASPIEGSSSIRSLGCASIARPMASICCSPPESVPASCAVRSFRRGIMV